jgi:hypothetical protein
MDVVGQPVGRAAGAAALAVLRSPVAWVLFLAGLFDGISDNWLHAAVLWGACFLVGWDAARTAQGRRAPRAVPLLRGRSSFGAPYLAVAVAAAGTYAVVVGAFARYTWPATVAVLLPGVMVLALGWRGPLWPRPVPARPRPVGAALWAAVFVAAGLWELIALLSQPSLQDGSYAHPTISFLMDTVLSSHAGRTITLLAWLVLGAFLLTRVPGRGPTGADDEGTGGDR